MNSVAKAARRVAANAVHISLVPAPSCIAESREVLRVLQRFGEVVTYKSLKYDPLHPAPNSALAIFQHPESAERLLNTSPLRFSLEAVPVEHKEIQDLVSEQAAESEYTDDSISAEPLKGDGEELYRTTSLLDEPLTPPTGPKATASPKSERKHHENDIRRESIPREFRLEADVWLGKHQDYLERSPLWGPFWVDSRTAIQQDLAKRVPLIGLSDIAIQKRTREIPLRILRKRQKGLTERKTLREVFETARSAQAQSHTKEFGDALSGLPGT